MYLLQHALTESAVRHPHRLAVQSPGQAMTYAQLDEGSNRLAHLLRRAGVQRGDRVGIFMEKSADAVLSIFGILKAGAAYVPLDPSAPPARLAYITRNCGLRLLVSGVEKAASWGPLREKGAAVESLVVVNAGDSVLADRPDVPEGVRLFSRDAVDAEATLPPAVRGIDLDLAYILYTSGSTGEPKGVMISHLNSLTFVRWAAREFAVIPEDVLSNHAPLHFDLSIFDIFAAATGGAAVVIVPRELSLFPVRLAAFIEEAGITVWYSVPSALSLLLLRGDLRPGAFPRLRTILFAGEVFPTPHLRALMERLPHVRFANLYGPTETNVCTWYAVPPLPPDQVAPIPIGRAIANVEVFALTDGGSVAGVGEVGELYVRGCGVALGYWGDAERTARTFVRHPFAGHEETVYRTGDLVQLTGEGDYLFLGRQDNQVKVQGHRVELGDAEAALYAHPDVAECAVVPVADEVWGTRLRAFVVPKDSRPLRAADLMHFAAERVPRYMVPDEIEFRSALPKTSTGKIDRKGLTA